MNHSSIFRSLAISFLCAIVIVSASGVPAVKQANASSAAAGEVTRILPVGRIGGSAKAVVLQGEYAYVGFGYEFTVLNIGDPAHPVRVGYVALPGVIEQIAIQGQYAYVAARDAGLRIVNISMPSHPIESGFFDTSQIVSTVAVLGSYGYIGGWVEASWPPEWSLRIIDISTPSTLTEVSHLDNIAIKDLAISENYLYIASNCAGLWIVDVTNPREPSTIYRDTSACTISYPSPPFALGIVLVDSYAYLAEQVLYSKWAVWSLRVFDISNPASPVEINSVDIDFGSGSGDQIAMVTQGHFVYLAAPLVSFPGVSYGKINIYDLTQPEAPVQVGSYHQITNPIGLDISGNIAFVAAGGDGLQILDASSPTSLTSVGHQATLANITSLAIVDHYAYVSDLNGGRLNVVDIQSPASPIITNTILTGGLRAIPSNGYLYLISNYDWQSELDILDISNPATPVRIGSCAIPGMPNGLALYKNYVFITDSGGLHVADTSNPVTPTIVGAYTSTETPTAIEVSGDYAYIGYESSGDGNSYIHPSLRVFDITNPISPTLVEVIDMPGNPMYNPNWVSAPYDIAIQGENLLTANTIGGFRIYNISIPEEPVLVSYSDSLYMPIRIEIKENYFYMLSEHYHTNEDLYVFDISNPAIPVKVDKYNPIANVIDIAIAGETIYAVTSSGGISPDVYSEGELFIFRMFSMHATYFPVFFR